MEVPRAKPIFLDRIEPGCIGRDVPASKVQRLATLLKHQITLFIDATRWHRFLQKFLVYRGDCARPGGKFIMSKRRQRVIVRLTVNMLPIPPQPQPKSPIDRITQLLDKRSDNRISNWIVVKRVRNVRYLLPVLRKKGLRFPAHQ